MGLSKVTESDEDRSFLRMRATKRLKLSSDVNSGMDHSDWMLSSQFDSARKEHLSSASSRGTYGEGDGFGAVISRPKLPALIQANQPAVHPGSQRDYVSESRSLMQQIRAARDFSIMSTIKSRAERSPGNTSGP